MSKLLIIAGSYSEYVDFCKLTKLTPDTDAKYVTNLQSIRGLAKSEFITVGTWWRNPDNFAYVDILTAREYNELNLQDYINERTKI